MYRQFNIQQFYVLLYQAFTFTQSLFVQIGDSNDKCSSLLEVEC